MKKIPSRKLILFRKNGQPARAGTRQVRTDAMTIETKNAIGRVSGPPILSRPAFPIGIEKKLKTILFSIVDQWRAAAVEIYGPSLAGLELDHKIQTGRLDADWQDSAKSLGEKLDSEIDRINAGASTLFGGTAIEVDQWNILQGGKWSAAIGAAVPGLTTYNPQTVLSATKTFSGQMATLITAVGDDTRAKVSQLVFTGIQNGERHELIAKKIFSTGEIGELKNPPFNNAYRRCEIIARDQIGKLNGGIVRARQVGLGIDRYIWRNVMDERVRGNPNGKYKKAVPSHWAREGLVFDWKNPPADGNPGEPILCRCWAEPYIEGVTAKEKTKPTI